ncbi:unnamed protein product, partial [Symbiodinium necroappetens]
MKGGCTAAQLLGASGRSFCSTGSGPAALQEVFEASPDPVRGGGGASGQAGKWTIWGKEAFDQNFNCARGFIQQSAANADLPHTLRSLWQCWDGKAWA